MVLPKINKNELFGISDIQTAFDNAASWISGDFLWLPTSAIWWNPKKATMLNDDLVAYIPFASVNYLLDWWALLHSSVENLLLGTTNTSIHLAYYAELKGAQSLMSLHWIFNFHSKNFQCHKTWGGNVLDIWNHTTHPAIAELFNQVIWDTEILPKFIDRLKKEQLCGVNLETYFDNLKIGGTTHSISLENILQYSVFDIAKFSEDRDQRNNHTYPPSNEYKVDMPSTEVLKELTLFWELLGWDINWIAMGTNFNLLLLKKLYDERWEDKLTDGDGNIIETTEQFEDRKMDGFIREMLEIASKKEGATTIGMLAFQKSLEQFRNSILAKYLWVVDSKSAKYILWLVARASTLLFASTVMCQEFLKTPWAGWLSKFIATKWIWDGDAKDACDSFLSDHFESLDKIVTVALSSWYSHWERRREFAKDIFICNTPEIIPAYLFSR